MKRTNGFTLLEVMGAVLILGLIGTSLMTATLESTRRTGEARDRLTASLLADSALADARARRDLGTLAAGNDQSDQSGFQVSVRTTPLDAAALGFAPLMERERDEPPAEALSANGRAAPPLYEIRVEVTAQNALVAERTSYLFDGQASQALQLAFGAEQAVSEGREQ